MTARAAAKIKQGLSEALAVARGEAEPYRVIDPAPTIHPIPGQCVYCDNRRAVNADAARRRRAKEKTP